MKTIFYDIKENEFNYLSENIPSNLEPYFFKIPLNSNTFIDEKFIDAVAISVFVQSELNKKVLEQFKNLKYIFLRSTGFSNVDLKYCKDNNIKVFNVPEYGSFTVAEYVFALILSLNRKISKAQNDILKGDINYENLTGFDLNKKTIGIIGLGKIGRKVLNIAYGFNMEALVYDINNVGAYNYVEFDELLKKSDYIVITCPLTNQTRKMINKFTLNLVKKTSFLINVARGEIVDTFALYKALLNKKLQGAALDVVECEELLCQNFDKCQKQNNIQEFCYKKYFFIKKLIELENVIITPHNAYNTVEANKRIIDVTMKNIIQVINKQEKPSYDNLVLL